MKGYRTTTAVFAMVGLVGFVGPGSAQAVELTITNLTPQCGQVTVEPDLDDYVPGTVVTLTGAALDGYVVELWDGNDGEIIAYYEDTIVIEIEDDTHFDVTFGPPQEFEITFVVEPTGAGIILADPDPGAYVQGTQVTLSALASDGYAFSHWDGDVLENVSETEVTVTVERDMDVVAVFDAAASVDSGYNDDSDNFTDPPETGPCGVFGPAALALTFFAMLTWKLRR